MNEQTAGQLLFEPRCSVCNRIASRIEIQGDGGSERMKYKGIMAGNGSGDPIGTSRTSLIVDAFNQPYDPKKIRAAGFFDDAGYCMTCQAFYCIDHWNPSTTGGGRCPKGHLKILDPY
jgi:hypothetical protein